MIDLQLHFLNSFFLKNNKYSKQEIYNNLLGHLEGGLPMYKTDKLLVYINGPVSLSRKIKCFGFFGFFSLPSDHLRKKNAPKVQERQTTVKYKEIRNYPGAEKERTIILGNETSVFLKHI